MLFLVSQLPLLSPCFLSFIEDGYFCNPLEVQIQISRQKANISRANTLGMCIIQHLNNLQFLKLNDQHSKFIRLSGKTKMDINV